MTTEGIDESPPIVSGFAALGLSDAIVATLTELGYEEPTPIQREGIPALIDGKDLLGQAATGTGKTAAFALPILHFVASLDRKARTVPSALILVPTRELAMQVAEAVHRYGRSIGVSVLPVYGGQAMQLQLRAFRRGVDVIVATPGRMVDHITRNSVDLTLVRTVVLDEADEMLDMGFAEDLEAILAALPKDRQTALFSATISPRIAQIAKKHLNLPIRITITRDVPATGEKAKVREVAYVVPRQHKIEALGRLLDVESPTSALVFCRMRTEVDQLTEALGARGYVVDALHGGHSQEQRERVMRKFRDGTTQLLIATDVAARGLDIGHLSHVINYDIPWTAEAYVHRVGRTGRAGREGVAMTLLEPRETRLLRNIEQVSKRKIAFEHVPTVHDVHMRRMELTSAAIREVLDDTDLAPYRVIVEALAGGGHYEALDIAAAAVKLIHETRDSSAPGTDADLNAPVPREATAKPKHDAASGAAYKKGAPASASKGRAAPKGRKGGGDYVRLYIPFGKKSGVRPADFVGAIANEAEIDASLIGAIEMTDNFTLVEVPDSDADRIVAVLRETTIRGKRVKARRERF